MKITTKRIITIIVISLIAVISMWQFINRYVYKPKAGGGTVTVRIAFQDQNLTTNPTNTFDVTVDFLPAGDHGMSGATIGINYPYDLFEPQLPADEKTLFKCSSNPDRVYNIHLIEGAVVQPGLLKITAVVPDGTQNLPKGNCYVKIPFKPKANIQLPARGTFSLDSTLFNWDIVGIVSFQPVFDENRKTLEVVVDNSVPIPTDTGTPIPSSAQTPTPTNTPTSTNSSLLNLKLKFQGITQKPTDRFNYMEVKVTIRKGNFESTQILGLTADSNGIWSRGASGFPGLQPGSGYTILVKGPKHIQKKICDFTPHETGTGLYRCADGSITINSGDNTLDFSGITQMSGDLPVQDGIVNSSDLSQIINSLGKSEPEVLTTSDINLDGIVNTYDYSLILNSLSVRTDEQ